jgi:two-component system cell cycle sensor histidine kinase/response regulator CckA
MTQIADHHRILVVDDNPGIHDDFRKILLGHGANNPALDAAEAILFDDSAAAERQHRVTFAVDSAFQGYEALEMVKTALAEGRPYSLAFVDVRMPPGWDGIETISQLWDAAPALQVVVCTAYSDYSWDKMSAKLGVSDNLVLLKKPFDNVEVLQLSHALTKKWLVTGQAQLRLDELERMVAKRTHELEGANAELRISEERFSQAFQNSPMPQAIQTIRAQRFVDANAAFLAMTGFQRDDLLQRTPLDLHLCLDYDPRFFAEAREGQAVREVAATISTRAGDLRQVLLSMEPLSLGGEPHVLLMVQDISDRLTLETQLRQAQKMEAVGQLAAGVAHDFNNLLTVIIGNCEFLLMRHPAGDPSFKEINEVHQNALRAATLVGQLLAFSRKQTMQPKVLALNDVVGELAQMLRRLLREGIELKVEKDEALWPVHADEAQLSNALINLVVNARDAMPSGGSVSIRLANETVRTSSSLGSAIMPAGEYVRLEVTDTGIGMSKEIQSKIFDPFFTTKPVGQGTGLGLATVYGIVKQSGGFIDVRSDVGKGTSFLIYLPRHAGEMPQAVEAAPAARDVTGQDTILLVEDEEAVRSFAARALRMRGYNVLEASGGDEALEIVQGGAEIHLIITDVVMPNMDGPTMVKHVKQIKPEIPVIFMSGYAEEAFRRDEGAGDIHFLPKPFGLKQLAAKVKDVLSGTAVPRKVG